MNEHSASGGFLESATDLLSDPDPGPTPFAIDGLLGEEAICMILGREKVGKTWLVLDFAVSIATGHAALGRFEVMRGPVILVVEESGRKALQRRLGRICAGRGIKPEETGDLHLAANCGFRLDDPEWRERLLKEAGSIKPRATFLDPLARVKGATVDESRQVEIGPILDAMRELRDSSGGAVVFVHHVGHGNGSRGRGSSDLEAYWESKIRVERRGETISLEASHREASGAGPFRFEPVFGESPASLVFEDRSPDAGANLPTRERAKAILSDGDWHKVADLARELGITRQGL